MGYNLKEDIAAQLVYKAFATKCNNAKYLVDFLFKTLSDDQISKFIEVLHMDGSPRVLKIGDVVTYIINKYDSFGFDKDILKDNGMSHRGYIYGIVTGDDSYGDDFNPWYYKINVNLITNDGAELCIYGHTIRTEDIKLLTNDKQITRVNKVYEKLQKKESPF